MSFCIFMLLNKCIVFLVAFPYFLSLGTCWVWVGVTKSQTGALIVSAHLHLDVLIPRAKTAQLSELPQL